MKSASKLCKLVLCLSLALLFPQAQAQFRAVTCDPTEVILSLPDGSTCVVCGGDTFCIAGGSATPVFNDMAQRAVANGLSMHIESGGPVNTLRACTNGGLNGKRPCLEVMGSSLLG